MPISAPPPAPATAVAAPAPGTYSYNASLNGASAGSSKIVVTRDAGGAVTISETASGSVQGVDFSGTASYALNADLNPASYAGKYQIAGQSPTAGVTFGQNTATVNGPMNPGGHAQTFGLLGGTSHFAVVEPGLVAGLFALPAQMHVWNGASLTVIAPVYGRDQALAPVSDTSPARPAGVPAGDASLSFGGNLPFTIWYDPTTLVTDEIDVPSQHASVTRVRG
jgi:hypothetical protein